MLSIMALSRKGKSCIFEAHWIGQKPDKKGTWQDVDEQHGSFPTYNEAFESIKAWWKQNDFEPLLLRMWKKENVTVIDYGPHDCFYHIVEIGGGKHESDN